MSIFVTIITLASWCLSGGASVFTLLLAVIGNNL